MSPTTSLSAFESEPISRLMLKFSLPAIISMVVNSLYNIVDQIFIGRGVGYLGNAATNINFPVSTAFLAVSSLIADGCVAYFSLKLGDKKYEEAAKAMANSFSLALGVGLLFTITAEAFLPQILRGCGGIPETETFQYALLYGRITLLGVPLVCVSAAVNAIIRAQGSPKYAMCSMLAGCFVNIALDAWFVMGLSWGVAGAAWATILGQLANFLLAVFYIPRFPNVPFQLKNAKLDPRICLAFLPLGLSGFCTQLVTALVTVCGNNLFVKYGTQSIYGPDIPLAAQGVALKLSSIIVSIMNGLGTGSQPIIGYNYGAKNYRRVRAAYLRTVAAGLICGFLGWACFRAFPHQIISLFGQENALYNEFAVKYLLNVFMLIFLFGFWLPSSAFFQAIGKAGKAMAVSLERNVCFFIPFQLILGRLLGVEGLLYAAPLSDLCSTMVVLVFVSLEMWDLNLRIQRQDAGSL